MISLLGVHKGEVLGLVGESGWAKPQQAVPSSVYIALQVVKLPLKVKLLVLVTMNSM